jgi:hypothetical protein
VSIEEPFSILALEAISDSVRGPRMGGRGAGAEGALWLVAVTRHGWPMAGWPWAVAAHGRLLHTQPPNPQNDRRLWAELPERAGRLAD